MQLKLATVIVPEPAAHEVVIRVEAAPLNPSDTGAIVGPADITRMRAEGAGGDARVVMPVPPAAMPGLTGKIGQPLATGNEGAGVVVAAGASAEAQALIGQLVATNAGGTYSRYRAVNLANLLVLKQGMTPPRLLRFS